ncbi:MAG: hypothetical protein GU362_04925 [Thaumarchaeota archaeon]|jgi:hypothetical protein|nr:hypothetical protein [Nitrososphaerota archaeon]
MKAAAISINGLSYSSFADCNPKFLLNLFSSTYRGVVENRDSFEPLKVWKLILKNATFEQLLSKGVLFSNIPITNPTYGRPSTDMFKVSLREELELMLSTINDYSDKYIVLFSINAYERDLKNKKNVCEELSLVDNYLKAAFEAVNNYMFFSPYGFNGTSYEPYGIYISSIPRPSEEETIKLDQILDIVLSLKI